MNRIKELNEKAAYLRETIIRMIHKAKSGHPGGSLSLADIFTVLYNGEMNIDPKDPEKIDRDRLILSKGHACPVLYSILAIKGYFDYNVIYSLRELGSILQGHPDMKKVPGVDMTTGSLGQGLSVAAGIAFTQKYCGYSARTYAILGDGELNEGQVWEAVMISNKYKLSNLVAVIDYNNLQLDGTCDQIMPIEPIDKKFESFGWYVIRIDGHDFEEILKAFEEARQEKDRPTCIIAKTIKGKGVCYMENQLGWHGKAPNDEEFDIAISDICKSKRSH